MIDSVLTQPEKTTFSECSSQTQDFSPFLKHRSAKVIAFTNQKGGVGKTTSAVNIAASLGVLGNEVLLIDLDPQGNATSGLGIKKKGLKYTAFELLTTNVPPEEIVLKTEFEHLSLIPTNTSLVGAEFDLGSAESGEFRLKRRLLPLLDKFDYILIDCPPSLGMLTVNAMAACNGIIIPMQCEFFALEGLSQLMVAVSSIKAHYNKEMSVTGILVTMFNGRLHLSADVMEELRKHYGNQLFSSAVSRNVKLSEAPGFGVPVYYHAKKSKGAFEYMNVAKELVERI